MLSDNIRVRGMPTSVGRYSTASNALVVGTNAETVISSPTTTIGSLTFQATQPEGMVIILEMGIDATSVWPVIP